MDDQRQAGLARRRDVGAEACACAGPCGRSRSDSRARPRRCATHLADARRARPASRPSRRAPRRRCADGCRPCRTRRLYALGDRQHLVETANAGRDRQHARRRPAAARARTTASRSAAKSGKSRWQWLSTSIGRDVFTLSGLRRLAQAPHSAGTPARAPAARFPARCRPLSARWAKLRASGGDAEQVEQLAGSLRHERLGQNSDRRAALPRSRRARSPCAPDRSCLAPRAPRRRSSGWRRPRPPRSPASMVWSGGPPSPRGPVRQAVGRGQNRPVGWRKRARLRHHAAAVLGDHRQRALRQIAEIVGEIGVDAVDDRLMAVAAVLAERHFAQEEVAHLVEAVVLDERERVDRRCRPTSTSSRRG